MDVALDRGFGFVPEGNIMSDRLPTFDELLNQQQEYTPASGPHARMINSMPLQPCEKFAVVCMSSKEFPAIRKDVKEFRGEDYTKWIVFTTAKDIHAWGAGKWSDAFYFSNEALAHFRDLPEPDANFIQLMVGGTTTAEFLQLDKPKGFNKPWWKRVFGG